MIELLIPPLIITATSIYLGKKTWTDQQKIKKVLELLEVQEGEKKKTFKLLRKEPINNSEEIGMEYVYKIPLKMSMDKIEAIFPAIRDGINIKREGKQKHIEIEYDGALKIKVFNGDLPDIVPFPMDLLSKCTDWKVPYGIYRDHKILWHDFDEIYHSLIGGTSGYGKTELIRLICYVLMITQPDNLKLTVIDLKGGMEFSNLNQYKQVNYVSKNEFEAEIALKEAVNEMESLQEKLISEGFRNVKQAGIKKRHFIIVDEAAELSTQGLKNSKDNPNPKAAREKCDFYLSKIARLGRSTGHRLIYCTQYPLRETINPQIKNNLDGRIAMRLQSSIASKVVLDEIGAEQLPFKEPGRALYKADKLREIQMYLPDENALEKLLEPYKVAKINEHNPEKPRTDRADFIQFGDLRIFNDKPDAEDTFTRKLP